MAQAMASEEPPARSSSDAEGEPPEEQPRERVGETRVAGLVIEWRGYMGWIHPLSRIDHEKAKKHQGRIYLNQQDVIPVEGKNLQIKAGKVVDFFVYVDHDGLGAEECRPRTPLRLTLPRSDDIQSMRNTAQWSEYLSDSEYFPAFEAEHGVMLRRYTWPMPFSLVELWGATAEELANAAAKLGERRGEGEDNKCSIRLLLPERDVPKVESLPHGPKVSAHAVLEDPVPCRTMNIDDTKENCIEVVKAFVLAMS